MVLSLTLSPVSYVHSSRVVWRFAGSSSAQTGQLLPRGVFATRRYSRSQGVAICARLLHSRRLQIASAVLAGALAVLVSRDFAPDLSATTADFRGFSSGPSQPVAYTRGPQESKKHSSASKQLSKGFHNRLSTMSMGHARLIDSLRQTHRLTDKTANAMLQVDRIWFLDPDNAEARHLAYQDHPVPIGYGETISAPHMHAEALRLLEDHCHQGASVLDVGSGSGYLTGCLGIMVGETGQVLGVEKHKELAERSMTSLTNAVPDLMRSGTVKIMPGNVLGKVLKEYGPFDAIHVGAAAATMPQNLVDKLKSGGRMVIPVGAQNSYQVLKLVDKDQDGKVQETDLMSVAFVPLTEPGTDPFVGKDEE